MASSSGRRISNKDERLITMKLNAQKCNCKFATGVATTAASALLFGFSPVLVYQFYSLGGTPISITFFRNLFAIPMALLWVIGGKHPKTLPKKQFPAFCMVGIVGLCVTTLLLYASYQYVDMGIATVLHFLYPVFAALLGRIVYKEHFSRRKKAALLVATAGLLFFGGGLSLNAGIGIAMALLSGVCYAYYIVMMERKKFAMQDVATVTLYLSIVVSIATLILGIASGQLVLLLPLDAYILAILTAAVTSFGAMALLQVGIRHLNATTAACFCLLEPISGVFFGCVFLGDPLTIAKLVGSSIILFALIMFSTEATSENSIK